MHVVRKVAVDRVGYGLEASVALVAGQEVFDFSEHPTVEPGQYTMQVGRDTHLCCDGDLGLFNHSCMPSVWPDVQTRRFVALRDLSPGSLLSYFYPATEWIMQSPFACRCGTVACVGTVVGARDLDRAVLGRYRLAPHIVSLLRR